jgi:hypothetical protein
MAGELDPSLGTYSFNPLAAGRKQYGGGATYSPSMGAVDKSGYRAREQRNVVKRNAYTRWLQAKQSGDYNNPNAQRLS